MKIIHPFGAYGTIEIDASAKLLDGLRNAMSNYKVLDFFGTDTFQPLSLVWRWGEPKWIQVSIKIKYDIILTSLNVIRAIGKRTYNVAALWQINYSDSGVSLHPEGDQYLGGTQPEGKYVVQAHITQSQWLPESADKTAVARLRLIGGYTDTGSFSVGKGPLTVNIGGSAQSGIKDLELTLICGIGGKPEKAAEPPKVPLEVLSHIADFENEDQKALEKYLGLVQSEWFDPLLQRAPELAEAISSGRLRVTLKGYTSTTGSDEYNKGLSATRIKSVEHRINSLFKTVFPSAKIDFSRIPLGKSTATQQGKVQQERRVEISISSADAQKIMSKTKPVSAVAR